MQRGRLTARLAGIREITDEDSASAAFLLAATVAALIWANLGDSYEAFWHLPLTVQIGDYGIGMDLQHWVNDALMTLFFFVVGLEVKRELTIGELTDRTRAAVPVVAAVAGLAVPVLLFLLLNPSGEAAGAWGVVISTDTAFVMGALALVGPRCPARLRIFLLTLAVADDIGALGVIALFYTDDLRVGPLVFGAIGLLGIALLRRLAVWRGVVYFLVAAATWVAFYESGVHPTLSGVLIALILPVYPPRRSEVERAGELARAFRQSPNSDYARAAQLGVLRAVSVNERLLRLYGPYTSFLVVPVFALANAGVVLSAARTILEMRPVAVFTASFGGAPRSAGAGMMVGACAKLIVAKRTKANEKRARTITYSLSLQQQVTGILDVMLDPHQKLHRLAAVDDAVIV